MWKALSTAALGTILCPYKAPKREYHFDLSNIEILPGKSFTNPNFVNNQHLKQNQTYNKSVDNSKSPIMCESRKRCKKTRRRKKKNKNNNKNRINTKEMMEIEEIPIEDSNIEIIIENDDNLSKEPIIKERQISVCESEDSFIVFDCETDEDLTFSSSSSYDDSEDTDDESDESDDDCDSSNSVVPCKKVRFAEKEDLCEIHPMVQWSFAYRNARKGPWEEYARDRERFNRRITATETLLKPVFQKKHRENIYRERFDKTK